VATYIIDKIIETDINSQIKIGLRKVTYLKSQRSQRTVEDADV